jgi:hypothetical protein
MDKNINTFLDSPEAKDPEVIVNYMIALKNGNKDFERLIMAMAEDVSKYFEHNGKNHFNFIAGGMRRDLVFSGPIADVLGLHHFSLPKTPIGTDPSTQKLSLWMPHSKSIEVEAADLTMYKNRGVVVSDLLTLGSSQYDIDKTTGRQVGWFPHLRYKGLNADCVFVAVSRTFDGGEKRLRGFEFEVNPYYRVDEAELERISVQPEIAKEYARNPRKWTENYLLENGVGFAVKYFDKNTKNFDRAIKFIGYYGDFLRNNNDMYGVLKKLVDEKYQIDIDTLTKQK